MATITATVYVCSSCNKNISDKDGGKDNMNIRKDHHVHDQCHIDLNRNK